MPPKKTKKGGESLLKSTTADNKPAPDTSGKTAKKIEVHNNNIYFTDDITPESIALLSHEIRSMDEELSTMKLNYKIDEIPIYLHITTDGGDMYAALSAYDMIISTKNPVYTVIDGYVESAGTILVLAGKVRYIKPNGFIMMHEFTTSMWGKMSEMNVMLRNSEKILAHTISIYLARTKIPAAELKDILKRHFTWNAKMAISHGIAHKIYKV